MEDHVVNPDIRYDDGPEVVPEAFSTKQVVPIEDQYSKPDPQVVEDTEGNEPHATEYALIEQNDGLMAQITSQSLLKQFRKRTYISISAIGIAIIIATVVAVAEVRKHEREANMPTGSSHLPTGDMNGAYNGTGLSVIYSLNSSLQVALFYQHSAGSIRTSRLVNDVWQSYEQSQDLIVSSEARKGTPIGSASYYLGPCCRDGLWQLFYVDSSNILRDTIRNDVGDTWVDGILANFNIRVSNTTSTGLFAIFGTASGQGIEVFYGGADNLVHEVTWHRNNSWTEGFTFPMSNGNAGIWATVRDSTTYVYLLNSNNFMEMWWMDYNTTVESTRHPTRVWTKGAVAGGDIRSNSVAVDGLLSSAFVQLIDNTFTLVPVIQNAESSGIANSQRQPGFVTGVANSRVAVYTNTRTSERPFVLYQTNGSDITQFGKNIKQSSWVQTLLPVS